MEHTTRWQVGYLSGSRGHTAWRASTSVHFWTILPEFFDTVMLRSPQTILCSLVYIMLPYAPLSINTWCTFHRAPLHLVSVLYTDHCMCSAGSSIYPIACRRSYTTDENNGGGYSWPQVPALGDKFSDLWRRGGKSPGQVCIDQGDRAVCR